MGENDEPYGTPADKWKILEEWFLCLMEKFLLMIKLAKNFCSTIDRSRLFGFYVNPSIHALLKAFSISRQVICACSFL